jgi:signal transduction histidine kinase
MALGDVLMKVPSAQNAPEVRHDFQHMSSTQQIAIVEAMKRLSIVQIIRSAGAMAWMLYPIGIILIFANRSSPLGDLSFGDILAFVALLTFGICFWVNMRDIPLNNPTGRHFVLLAMQLLASFGAALYFGDAGLLYVLAAEIPLVLKREQSVKWIVWQAVLSIPWSWFVFANGYYEASGEFKNISPTIQAGMVSIAVVTWQLFAFSVGWLAANETRNRRELARLNMELLAARQSLEEKSRVEERLRISRELHDVMGHHLVALNLQLELANRTIPNAEPSPITTAIKIAKDLLAEARKIVSVLRQEQTNDLTSFILTLQGTIPYPAIYLEVPEHLEAPNEVQHAFLRCIQEAVSNTLRHSNASKIWITLSQDAEHFHLSIQDDGAGFDDVPAGNGIAGMRERVEQLAGTMSLASSRGQGCRIDIDVPGKENT